MRILAGFLSFLSAWCHSLLARALHRRSFGAADMFDGMPETPNVEEDKETTVMDDEAGCISMLPDGTLQAVRSSLPSPDTASTAAAADGDDCISALPDAILHEVLSFLSSREAVRTCLLATRWRDVWKSVPALRVNISPKEDYSSAAALAKFVNHLLRLRDPTAALRQCVIRARFEKLHRHEYEDRDQALQYVEQWIQYAIFRKVQILRVEGVFDFRDRVELSNATLISKHLRSLHLYSFKFKGRSLDLSSCDSLEQLMLESCDINPENIFPKSLRHLSISFNSTFLAPDTRTSISAPSLITLYLTFFWGWTPLFESMPLLETAYISSEEKCHDCCENVNYYGDCGIYSCKGCYGKDHDSSHCVILDRLSGVTDLTLMSDPRMFIFRKDLKWRTMFSNLKTLLLREWCVVPDSSGLVYFLQHSPILEKLTLQFALYSNMLEDAEIDESYSPMKQFMASKHLKVVKIKCLKEDERVHHILKILCTHGVPREKIDIQVNWSFAYS
ncbi:unnamed protein product [Alopecurus aequalis]